MLGSIFSVPVYADNTDANTVDIVDTANTPDTASEETETPLPYTEEENAEDYVPDMEDNNTAVYSEPEYEQTVSLMATSLSGAGTSNSPYLIYNKNDLLQLSASTDTTFLSAHFQLQNDITLTSDNWSPIGINKSTPFKGTFDGNGHIINNVNIPENSYSYAGLFGVVTGTIRNLGVASDIEGVSTAGALAGLLYGGTVEYCYSTGAVSSTSGYTGGLIGYSEDSTIHDCYSMASATNTSTSGSVGGLSGYLYAHSNNTTVKDCYATGAVTGSCKNIGGLDRRNSHILQQ